MGTEAPTEAESDFTTESPSAPFVPAIIFLVTAEFDDDGELTWTLHLNRRLVTSGITLVAINPTGTLETIPPKADFPEDLIEDYESLKILAQYVFEIDGVWSSELLFDTHTVTFAIGLAYDPVEVLLDVIEMVAKHFSIEIDDVGVKLPGAPFVIPFIEVSEIASDPTPFGEHLLGAVFEFVDPFIDSATEFAESMNDRIKGVGVQFSESVPPEVRRFITSIFGQKDDESPTSAPR